MKASKSTQTAPLQPAAVHVRPTAVEADPLAAASASILLQVRGIEVRLMEAMGLTRVADRQSAPPGQLSLRGAADAYAFQPTSERAAVSTSPSAGTAIFDEAALDDFARFRIATVAASIVRAAEEAVAVELGRIAQLVPHAREGATYSRAALVQPPQPPHVDGPGANSAASPQHLGAPSPSRVVLGRGGAAVAPGLDVRPTPSTVGPALGVAVEPPPQATLPPALQSPVSHLVQTPLRASALAPGHAFAPQPSAIQQRGAQLSEHRERLKHLNELARRFAQPGAPAAAESWTPAAAVASVGGPPLFHELRSARARQYAEQFGALMTAAPGPADSDESDFAGGAAAAVLASRTSRSSSHATASGSVAEAQLLQLQAMQQQLRARAA